MKTLKLSTELALPLDAITERLGWLGTSGSGKTYGAGRLAEEMLEIGAQVVVLDPVGPWWGLRSSADGKSAGYPILVFGGIHGDLPLTPESGALVADVIVDREISAVLDVSDMTVGEMHRFVSAFAERFFDRKKRKATPVHLFLEEAHTFLPQQLPPEPAAAVMLHRMERIVRVGRNYGIGTSQISQLPQAVTKKTLNTVACLFAFGTIGSQERKALAAWFDQNGGGDLAKELPGLATGVAWAVSPRWLRLTKKLKVSEKRTFDASETPKFGAKPTAPKVLAPVDVEQLRTALAETIAEAQKDDPKALRKRIVDLERELAKKPAAPAPEVKVVEKPVLTDEHLKRIETLAQGDLARALEQLAEMLRPVVTGLAAVHRAPGFPQPMPMRESARAQAAALPTRPRVPVARSAATDGAVGKGERAMLEALASRHPTALTRNQVAMLSGYTASGGTFAKYLSTLRGLGFVETRGELLSITDAGLAAAGEVSPVDDVVGMWRVKLGGGEQKLFDALVSAYPNGIERHELGQLTGYEASGGTFAKYLSTLKSIGVAEVAGGQVRATDDLFPEVRR